jgi:hypothetical protein
MTPSEAAEILTVAAAFDSRTVGESDAIAWSLALAHLDPDACRRAVITHYASETDRVMPAHIRRLVATRTGPTAVDLPQCERCHGVHDRTEPCDVLRPPPPELIEAVKTPGTITRRVAP